ncbi:ABC transporter permease [Paenibacillus sp. 79R4]|uniref:ABC transporter permease n=1 Tax=Paenibacillus sp. 79R4 TaxID=2212847 RepID=UPI0015BA38EB|nr:ABC transporter permease [Paenibacillus sp. 79R4]NWL89027.1 ABC transporter permease [Paenibacillus sp. 79R4]
MYLRIVRNDMSKSRLVTLTTTIFIAAAAMLVSLAAILIVNLTGALDAMMTQARTPHFMQMHSGEIDSARLELFANRNEHVDQFQVLEFLNMDGSQFRFGDHSLTDSIQDNGLSVQSEKFDYLLDLNGKVINVSDGEIYVPVTYMKEQTIKMGDKAVIGGKEFQVAGFLRDSQMNSMLASSKRFLISRSDFEQLKDLGSIEYLIEFRLKDLAKLGEFETAYASAGLEANGPAITYPLFKMINALSDGMMIGVILLVSILVVAIALMCIRFTLLAKMEDDYREIGVMKAIGLRVSDIKKIYLAKYAVLAAAGSIIGYALSLIFKGVLLENIRLYMGESENSSVAAALGIFGVLLVFLAIIGYVNGVLRRFRKISAAEAIRQGTPQDKAPGSKHFHLSGNKLLNTNIFLGIKDVLARKKLYTTMLVVLIISVFIMVVPQNLYNTISSKSFIQYMGIGNYDMRIDIQQTDHMPERAAEMIGALRNDRAIAKYAVLATKTFKVKREGGSEENIKVELGDHTIFPIQYAQGKAPAADDEIALSVLNADELGKKLGDPITLVIEGRERSLTISGIYSDITNGGKTAKAGFADQSAGVMWYVICAELSNPSLIEETTLQYADRYSYAKVSDIDAFVAQTFGSTIGSVKKASHASILVALIIVVLVALLFMKMLVAKDRYTIAVMKVFGYTTTDIRTQYLTRSGFVLIVGIVLGTLLANTLGGGLAGVAISSFGVAKFQFAIHPLSAYLLSPLLLIGSVLIATMIGTAGARRIQISESIKE